MITLILLFFVGLFAGLVDAIAGGGGLITIPALLSAGLNPSMSIGTNKLQSSVGTLMAATHFYREGFFSLRDLFFGLVLCAIGAFLGAKITSILDPQFLKEIVPFLLLAILIYMIAAPRLKIKTITKKRLSTPLFYGVFGLLLGFYDGFFGPGTGSFWMFALMFFLGFDILKATAHTKIFNLTSNLIALIFFIYVNQINYQIGFTMALGQLVGGQMGARIAINKGQAIIRPLFLMTVAITILLMFVKNFTS